jgi:hypothetical protein
MSSCAVKKHCIFKTECQKEADQVVDRPSIPTTTTVKIGLEGEEGMSSMAAPSPPRPLKEVGSSMAAPSPPRPLKEGGSSMAAPSPPRLLKEVCAERDKLRRLIIEGVPLSASVFLEETFLSHDEILEVMADFVKGPCSRSGKGLGGERSLTTGPAAKTPRRSGNSLTIISEYVLKSRSTKSTSDQGQIHVCVKADRDMEDQQRGFWEWERRRSIWETYEKTYQLDTHYSHSFYSKTACSRFVCCNERFIIESLLIIHHRNDNIPLLVELLRKIPNIESVISTGFVSAMLLWGKRELVMQILFEFRRRRIPFAFHPDFKYDTKYVSQSDLKNVYDCVTNQGMLVHFPKNYITEMKRWTFEEYILAGIGLSVPVTYYIWRNYVKNNAKDSYESKESNQNEVRHYSTNVDYHAPCSSCPIQSTRQPRKHHLIEQSTNTVSKRNYSVTSFNRINLTAKPVMTKSLSRAFHSARILTGAVGSMTFTNCLVKVSLSVIRFIR